MRPNTEPRCPRRAKNWAVFEEMNCGRSTLLHGNRSLLYNSVGTPCRVAALSSLTGPGESSTRVSFTVESHSLINLNMQALLYKRILRFFIHHSGCSYANDRCYTFLFMHFQFELKIFITQV